MATIFKPKGCLFLIGGAEDRTGEKRVLKRITDHVRPKKIIIIPTASGYPWDIDRCYTATFGDLGVKDTECLDIRYRDEADREEHLAAIDTADLIYFSGGDQVRLVETLNHTRFFDRIKARFEAGALHIAGTSAGAAAAGNPVFYDGDRRGTEKGTINFSDGFGLIDGVAIDTHFTARNRLARLCQCLISGRCTNGIGIDEDTGIMVQPNMQLKVFGSGMVTVANSAHVTGSNYRTIDTGGHLRFNNMRIGFLPAGSTFSIRKWSIINRGDSGRQFDLSDLRAARR
jgi:cyanophycinase